MVVGALHRYSFIHMKKKEWLELERKIQEFLKPKKDLVVIDRSDLQIIEDKLGTFSKSVSGSVTVKHIPTGYTRVVYVSQAYEKETYNPYVVYSCSNRSGWRTPSFYWYRTMSGALSEVWGDKSWFKELK